jgi:hypothetical protein
MHSFYKPTKTEKIADKIFTLIRSFALPRPLVNFFVAGTAKGGTTALHYFLDQHPEICMPHTTKELHFFDNDRYFLNLNSVLPPYKKYHSNFASTSLTKIYGEACPNYMWSEKAPERIYEYNPASKIILLLRNPIYRAYSHWNMASGKLNEKEIFLNAISTEIKRIRVSKPRIGIKGYTSYQHKTFSHLDRGYYTSQIHRLLRFFSEESILIFLSEDLQNDHDQTLIKIFDFLGVSTNYKVNPKTIHKREYKEFLGSEEFEILKNHFEPEIKSLEALINRDLSHWLKYPNKN